ncbi:unnamed protein product [Paramecium sonneborni]|uniref:Uncharacterized protein n=1 Tax=Paramecium sonneborni TaxID=65129 RepID=A0A8S1RF45_9CILI|nr:unnamed protein product [Paramecium sonneborni]
MRILIECCIRKMLQNRQDNVKIGQFFKKVIRENINLGFTLEKLPDKKWLTNVLHTLNRENIIFQKYFDSDKVIGIIRDDLQTHQQVEERKYRISKQKLQNIRTKLKRKKIEQEKIELKKRDILLHYRIRINLKVNNNKIYLESKNNDSIYQFQKLYNNCLIIKYKNESGKTREKSMTIIQKQKQKYRITQNYTGNIGVLGAIGQDGFIAYQVVRGNVNSNLYAQHLLELIKISKMHYLDCNFLVILEIVPSIKVRKQNPFWELFHTCFCHLTHHNQTQEKVWNSFKKYFNKQIFQQSEKI